MITTRSGFFSSNSGDDNEEVLRNRLNVYREQTAPLVEFYRGKGLLKSVDGMADIDHVTNEIEAILSKL